MVESYKFIVTSSAEVRVFGLKWLLAAQSVLGLQLELVVSHVFAVSVVTKLAVVEVNIELADEHPLISG